MGLAMPLPTMSGALPWLGSYRAAAGFAEAGAGQHAHASR